MATKAEREAVRGRTYKFRSGADRAACRVGGKVVKKNRGFGVRVPRR